MDILIAGGGLAGLTLAPLLKAQGYSVVVVERGRLADLKAAEAKSINLTLTRAGREELREAGLLDKVRAIGSPLQYRRVHGPHGRSFRQSYEIEPSGWLLSLKRTELLGLLIDEARQAGVPILEQTSFHSYDKKTGQVRFEADGQFRSEMFDLVIGADGVFSSVRREMIRGETISFAQNFFAWRYLKFDLSSSDLEELGLDLGDLHVWSASGAMVVGIPNRDRSLSAILMLACGADDEIQTGLDMALRNLERRHPDLISRISDRVRGAVATPGHFVEVRLRRWVWSDRIVLLGDAAHAMYPFYGLGFNTALADVGELARQLARPVSRREALLSFQQKRLTDAERARALSEEQFSVLHQAWMRERSPTKWSIRQLLRRWNDPLGSELAEAVLAKRA